MVISAVFGLLKATKVLKTKQNKKTNNKNTHKNKYTYKNRQKITTTRCDFCCSHVMVIFIFNSKENSKCNMVCCLRCRKGLIYRDKNVKEMEKEFLLQYIVKVVTKEEKEIFVCSLVQEKNTSSSFPARRWKDQEGMFRVASITRPHQYLISICRLPGEITGFISGPVLAWVLVLGSGVMVQLWCHSSLYPSCVISLLVWP